MASWDYWFPDVLVHAHAAPEPLVRQVLCRSAREFCRRTHAWMEWLDPSVTRSGDATEYDFDLPSQSELLRIERATLNGQPFQVQSFRECRSDWTRPPSGDRSLVSRDLSTYTLTGASAPGDQIQVQVSLLPSVRATGMPDDLAARHMEAIGAGALKHLLLMPLYMNEGQAMLCAQMFEAACNTQHYLAYKGHTKNTPRVRAKWC